MRAAVVVAALALLGQNASMAAVQGGAPVPVHIAVQGKGGVRWGAAICSPKEGEAGASCVREVPGGVSVTFEARPHPGQSFTGWTGACKGSGPRCILMPKAGMSLGASFAPITAATPPDPGKQVSIKINLNGARGGGRVASTAFASTGVDCRRSGNAAQTGNCWATVPAGTRLLLAFTPEAGTVFKGWSGLCSGKAECSFVANANGGIAADYETNKRKLVLHYTMSAFASLTVVTSDYYIQGDSCTHGPGGKTALTCTMNLTDGSEQYITLQKADLGIKKYTAPGSVWKSGCDRVEGNSCVVKMNADRVIMASDVK